MKPFFGINTFNTFAMVLYSKTIPHTEHWNVWRNLFSLNFIGASHLVYRGYSYLRRPVFELFSFPSISCFQPNYWVTEFGFKLSTTHTNCEYRWQPRWITRHTYIKYTICSMFNEQTTQNIKLAESNGVTMYTKNEIRNLEIRSNTKWI